MQYYIFILFVFSLGFKMPSVEIELAQQTKKGKKKEKEERDLNGKQEEIKGFRLPKALFHT